MCLGSECDHSSVERREFLTGGAAVLAGLAATGLAGADDEKKPPPTRVLDDITIRHGKVRFKSGDKEIDGYLARPKAEGKYPAVLVVAGNLITEEYIPNTCAALAVAGFLGLAPNIFHSVPQGATPKEMNHRYSPQHNTVCKAYGRRPAGACYRSATWLDNWR